MEEMKIIHHPHFAGSKSFYFMVILLVVILKYTDITQRKRAGIVEKEEGCKRPVMLLTFEIKGVIHVLWGKANT